MKSTILFLFMLQSFSTVAQCECTAYYSPRSFLSIVLQNDDTMQIIDEAKSYNTDGLIHIYTVFEGSYSFIDKMLTLVRENEKYSFRLIDDGILKALGSVDGHIKKGDKFYCTSFKYKDSRLIFSVKGEAMGWRNEKMDGTWIFRDHKFEIYHFEYDKGKIVKKIYIPKKHESHVLKVDQDSLRKRQYQEIRKFK